MQMESHDARIRDILSRTSARAVMSSSPGWTSAKDRHFILNTCSSRFQELLKDLLIYLLVWSIRVELSMCDLWNTLSILLTPLLVSPFSQHTFFSSLFLFMLFLMCKFSIVLIFATFSFVYVPTLNQS